MAQSEYEIALDAYVSSRRKLLRRYERLREELDAWLDAQSYNPPDIAAIAHLEAMQTQRNEVFSELQKHGERFIEYLLAHRRAREATSDPS